MENCQCEYRRSSKEQAWLFVSITICLIVCVACLLKLNKEVTQLERRVDQLELQPPVQVESEIVIKVKPVEDPIEFQLTEDDYEVLKIITAESGTNKDLCYGVTQALFNGCIKEDCTPLEATKLYKYTSPVDWYSDEAYQAFNDIFVNGEMYQLVEDALYFYAPKYVQSDWHESMNFIIEIDGVRFFGD